MGWDVDTGEGLEGMGQSWTTEHCTGALGGGLGSPRGDEGLLVPHPFLRSPRRHRSPSFWHVCPCPAQC